MVTCGPSLSFMLQCEKILLGHLMFCSSIKHFEVWNVPYKQAWLQIIFLIFDQRFEIVVCGSFRILLLNIDRQLKHRKACIIQL